MEELALKEEEAQKLLYQIREIREKYDGKPTMMPAETQENCLKMFADLDTRRVEIDALKKGNTLDSKFQEYDEWYQEPAPLSDAAKQVINTPSTKKATGLEEGSAEEEALRERLRKQGHELWIKKGMAYIATRNGAPEQAFKALQADSDPAGGYVVSPKTVTESLIEEIDDKVWIRGMARMFKVQVAQSLGAPVRDEDISDPIWTAEIDTGDEDDVHPFNERELVPHPLAKRVKISNKMLMAPGMDIESYWLSRLSYKFGTAMENNFLTGNGVNQPLGLLTPHAAGIPLSRDITTGSSTGFTDDGLLSAQYMMKEAYWKNCWWMFSRESVLKIRLLKDGENRFIWQPGLQGDQPDMILGRPFVMSEFMPSTYTNGSYVGLYGDFSHYWIVDSLMMQTQRLNELYAEKNQTGYIARMESDGQPTLPEAFVRIKVGA
jgi:HK97 family phage major capsid protein